MSWAYINIFQCWCEHKRSVPTQTLFFQLFKGSWLNIPSTMRQDIWCLFRLFEAFQGSTFPNYHSTWKKPCYNMLNKPYVTLPMLKHTLQVLSAKPFLGKIMILCLQDGWFDSWRHLPEKESGVFPRGSRLCHVEEIVQEAHRDMDAGGIHLERG